MSHILILCARRPEAYAWAQANGLPFRAVRFVQNTGSFPSNFRGRVVELPSYQQRRDRFAIDALLKRMIARGAVEVEKPTPQQDLDAVFIAAVVNPPPPSSSATLSDEWVEFGYIEDESSDEEYEALNSAMTDEGAPPAPESEITAEQERVFDELVTLGRDMQPADPSTSPPPRRRGRPKGSRNRPKPAEQTELDF